MVTREEEQLAKRILEASEWNMKTAMLRMQTALWMAMLRRFKWNIRQTMMACGINRTYGYRLLGRLGIRRPLQSKHHRTFIMRWPVAKISRDNRV